MSEQTLFDTLGGPAGVAEIVHEMYSRVLADPELAPFFQNVQIDRLRRMQYQFIASALDGPIDYSGAELTAVHKNRGITGHHFAKFCGHFADALEAHGASRFDVDQALGRLATYKDKITGETNIDG
jgi:hemoglobin